MNAAVGLMDGLGLDGDRCIRVIPRQNISEYQCSKTLFTLVNCEGSLTFFFVYVKISVTGGSWKYSSSETHWVIKFLKSPRLRQKSTCPAKSLIMYLTLMCVIFIIILEMTLLSCSALF